MNNILTNHSEHREVFHHELHRDLYGVELQQVDEGLLGELRLGVLRDELVRAEDVLDVVAGGEADALGQVLLLVGEALLAHATVLMKKGKLKGSKMLLTDPSSL